MPKKRRCKRSTQLATGVLRGREIDFMVTLPCGVKKVRPLDIERMANKLSNAAKQRLVDDPDSCKVSFIKAESPVVFCDDGPGRKMKPRYDVMGKKIKQPTPPALKKWVLPSGPRDSEKFQQALKDRCLKIVKGRFRKRGGKCQVAV